MDKILICQPVGGINDMLCQIGMCIEYSEKFNRKLIIDTTKSDLNDHFSHYFETNDLGKNIQIELSMKQINTFYNDPLFPKDCYLTHSEHLYPMSVPLDRDYKDKFLLHRTWGGGVMSLYALKYFKLQDYLINRIKKRKKSLGTYHAILIRHTDYNTDYKNALNEIKDMNLQTPLYVFTDSTEVQEYARTLKFKKLIVNENIYKGTMNHIPIMHYSRLDPMIHPFEINDEVLMDLFLSSLSEHIYPTYVTGYQNNNQYAGIKFKSGFVNLAIELNNDKKLLNNILGN
jgi:hypothetical protein